MSVCLLFCVYPPMNHSLIVQNEMCEILSLVIENKVVLASNSVKSIVSTVWPYASNPIVFTVWCPVHRKHLPLEIVNVRKVAGEGVKIQIKQQDNLVFLMST